jgi:hypothetical protein
MAANNKEAETAKHRGEGKGVMVRNASGPYKDAGGN